jgi:hypothetical protein
MSPITSAPCALAASTSCLETIFETHSNSWSHFRDCPGNRQAVRRCWQADVPGRGRNPERLQARCRRSAGARSSQGMRALSRFECIRGNGGRHQARACRNTHDCRVEQWPAVGRARTDRREERGTRGSRPPPRARHDVAKRQVAPDHRDPECSFRRPPTPAALEAFFLPLRNS